MKLPLIDVYPIAETPPTQMMIEISKLQGESLPETEMAKSPREFAEITATKFFVNGLQMDLERKLRNSAQYKFCKNSMPPLKDVPNIRSYTTSPRFE